jgi:transposase
MRSRRYLYSHPDDQHQVQCGCGAVHTAARPDGARAGQLGYGPNLAAFVVYLRVVQFLAAHRVVALLESLTGAAPSVGFVHGMLTRTAGQLGVVHDQIRALITLTHAVSCDETPLRIGPRLPKPSKKRAERYLLVFCTELYTTTCSGTDLWPRSRPRCSPNSVHELTAQR